MLTDNNIKQDVCQGCEKQCALGCCQQRAVLDFDDKKLVPTVAGMAVTEYVDENGVLFSAGIVMSRYVKKSFKRHLELCRKVTEEARRISTLCADYRTR
ncbi:MAG: hypothetical protein IKZ34_02765 [Alphaproteobacteria bacterium]|jgi:hypothetical protein|nr:hypothetical protein [Alphaproteobacteria bacterium]